MRLLGVVVDGGENEVKRDEEEDVEGLTNCGGVAEEVREGPDVVGFDEGALQERCDGVESTGYEREVRKIREEDGDADCETENDETASVQDMVWLVRRDYSHIPRLQSFNLVKHDVEVVLHVISLLCQQDRLVQQL
jgi:hypothetical protein